MVITSTQNSLIKELKNLQKEKDILCLDNPKLVDEALKNNFNVLYILKTEDCNKIYTDKDIIVSNNVLNIFSNTITSQGVIAFVRYTFKELKPPSGNFLVLDRIQDPGNVGTLVRSAVGANFLDIYLISCASVCLNKTIRSTMGAIFKCNLYEVDESFYEILKNWKQKLYVADMEGNNLYTEQFDKNVGIVVGNEGKGVSVELESIATNKVKIPMLNNLESLNAGVSGSIIMYQITNGGKNVRS